MINKWIIKVMMADCFNKCTTPITCLLLGVFGDKFVLIEHNEGDIMTISSFTVSVIAKIALNS